MGWPSYLLPRNQSCKSKRITRGMCIPSSIWPDASSASRPNVTSQRLHKVQKAWDGITADHCDLSESHPAYNQGDRKVNLGLCCSYEPMRYISQGFQDYTRTMQQRHSCLSHAYQFRPCRRILVIFSFFFFVEDVICGHVSNRRRGSSWVTRYLLSERKWPDGWGSQVTWSSFLKVNE